MNLYEWCIENNREDLIQEWDNEKNNGLSPSDIMPHTNKSYWWKCKLGHFWKTSPNCRTGKGKTGCPYCKNQKVLLGFNDIFSTYPDLEKDWDYSKNDISPKEITAGSARKVWWKCHICGYEWQVAPVKRKIHGCPSCSNKAVTSGFNDLATLNPLLTLDWNSEKNDKLPSQFTIHSGEKVWWKCHICGYEWKTTIASRTDGRGCPNCLKGTQTSLPEKVLFFYINKYFDDAIESYKPGFLNGRELDIFIPSLNVAFEYDGEKWHRNIEKDKYKDKLCLDNNIELVRFRDDDAPIYERADKTYLCHYNQGMEFLEEPLNDLFLYLNEKYHKSVIAKIDIKSDYQIIYDDYIKKFHYEKPNNIAITNPELLDEWDYEKNGDKLPEYYTPKAHNKVWWKCKEGHSWQAIISSRTRGSKCPYCSNHFALKGYNDLETMNPKLAAQWNYEKNGDLLPEQFTIGSSRVVWWKCEKGHEWKTTIASRNAGNGCPYCSNKKLLVGYNDLATTNPELLKEWDYSKNDILPTEVVSGSSRKVWWICNAGHSYQASINSRAQNHTGCRRCIGKINIKNIYKNKRL